MRTTRMNTLAVIFAAGLTVSTMSLAQEPVAVGDQFQVNTVTTDDQTEPAVATDPSGDFVVVWKTDTEVHGARFASDGSPLGGEFVVAATGEKPRVARNADGFVIAWVDSYKIQAKRFGSDGVQLGAQFEVNTTTTALHQNPNISMDSSGAFVVIWNAFAVDFNEVLGRVYASDGSPIGTDFQVNSYTTGPQFMPAVAFLDGEGSFIAVWASDSISDPVQGILGRHFSSLGFALGPEFQANSYTTDVQAYPKIASQGDGRFVVAWESRGSVGDDDLGYSVQGRRFTTDGSPLGAQFQVNQWTTDSQFEISVSANSQGAFIVTWQSPNDQLADSIFGRSYDSSGLPLGGEFQINTYLTSNQTESDVAVDPSGDFVVVWDSDGSAGTDNSNLSVQGRRYRGSGMLGDFVWFDENGDGIQDGDETGLGGATIDLMNDSGQTVATTVSAGDGSYLFPKVAPGDYFLRVFPPQGYLVTEQDAGIDDAVDSDVDEFGQTDVFTVLLDVSNLDLDIGCRFPKIGDRVWLDLDGNGIQDGGEGGVSGVTVSLFDNEGTEVDQTMTGADGRYAMYAPASEYYLVFTAPADHAWTMRDTGFDDTIDSDVSSLGSTVVFFTFGGDDTSWDAGLVPTAAVLGDRVWLDTDLDGIQDGGEFGVQGVSVTVFDVNGVAQDSDVTGSDGSYSFTGLSSGMYYLSFTPPAAHCFTAPDQGVNDEVDSDVDPESYTTALFTLDEFAIDFSQDAGLVPEASVGNRVWNDDGNGIQDGGEPGVPGVTVRLYEADGTFADQATTSGEGLYSFSPGPGDYYLEFILPSDTAFAPRDQGGDDTAVSDVNAGSGTTSVFTLSPGAVDASRDAGLEPAAIGNFVWDDADGDGRQSPTEGGVAGVTVRLLDASGTEVLSTVTGADGIYGFLGVASGSYRIEVVAPVGRNFSPQNVGGNGLIDSDVHPSTGQTEIFVYEAGSAGRFYDAGLQAPPPPSLPFIDSFESGDASAWSRTVP